MWVQIRGVSLDGIGLPHFLLLVRLGTRLGHVCSFGGRRQPRRSSAAALNIVSTREAAAAKMATGNATYAQPRSRVSFLTRTSMTITVATASTMTVIAIHHEPRVVPRSCSLLSSSMRRGYPWLVRQNGSRTFDRPSVGGQYWRMAGHVDADYLVVGAGAAGMAFVDALIHN